MASVAWEWWLATYITGSGDVALADAIAAAGGQTFSGTGDVSLGSALSGTAVEVFSGTGNEALAATLAGSGSETFSGTGALAQSYAIAGTETETFTGTGAVALALTANGSGDNTVAIFAGGFTPLPFVPYVVPPLPAVALVAIVGRGSIAIPRLGISAEADITDDELVLLLAA